MQEWQIYTLRNYSKTLQNGLLGKVSSNVIYQHENVLFFRCQTYEGGFSGAPGLEAHGGYTYCGLAALTLMKAQHLCRTESLLVWYSCS